MLEQDIKKVLITEEEIRAKSKELGQLLTKEYAGKNPILIGVLKGSVPFLAELIKHIDTHVELEFMIVSSYHGGTESSGHVNIIKDVDVDVAGRDVIFVEDIIDTGRTLKDLRELFLKRQPSSVKIVTLVDKPEGRVVEIEADYTGFIVPNEFLIGFGLDYAENYRNLPYIGVLKEEVYSN
ncbi:hypoxanthine phosphoribosyltransferase [Streptococcus moroccensis]|uniref:Hypoxanthine phosphoribosyltransferase n=1 Tax=Streptococcus moroccensis TaxID=1451356 RepID=A0ABT9YU32_9STRE|nr:hypoxanthine phosphoribosyltransferase [Streptococcus moroccensis]MDQ0223498.1 hypoxanthine phosphoribosyltransferase [Streptococcus moroccensis]